MTLFQEKLYDDHSQVFTVERELYRGRTAFQDVLVFENKLFGRVLVLDGIVQLTERDNHVYHEMIVHVPMLAHGSAKRVLVIGGGDGGALKEVLKHPVDEVTMVEIDGEVVELSQRFFPGVSNGAFTDPRLRLVIADAVAHVAREESKFDVIIVDSTDPVGPGEQLFTSAFYANCRGLLRPGGLIALQSGAPFYNPQQLDAVCARLADSVGAVRPFLAPVPTYAGGMLALVIAAESDKTLWPSLSILHERFRHVRPQTSFYTPDIHRAAFAMAPAFRAA